MWYIGVQLQSSGLTADNRVSTFIERGDFMSLSAIPERVEDKVLETLTYTPSYDIDDVSEFTVRRYADSLQHAKENGPLSDKQYAALLRCYFKISLYRNRIPSLIDEAYRMYPESIMVHAEATMCLQSSVEHGMIPETKFDLREYWFDDRFNGNHVDFSAWKISKNFTFLDKEIQTIKRLATEIVLRYPSTVVIDAGPFSIEKGYIEMKNNKFNILLVIVNRHIEDLRTGRVTEEKNQFLSEYFKKSDLDFIESIGNRPLSPEEIKDIEEAEEDIENGNYAVFDSVEDFIATL